MEWQICETQYATQVGDRDCGQGDPWGYGVLGSGCWACELTLLLLPGWGPHVGGQEQDCLSQLDVPAGDTCRFIYGIRTNKGNFLMRLLPEQGEKSQHFFLFKSFLLSWIGDEWQMINLKWFDLLYSLWVKEAAILPHPCFAGWQEGRWHDWARID